VNPPQPLAFFGYYLSIHIQKSDVLVSKLAVIASLNGGQNLSKLQKQFVSIEEEKLTPCKVKIILVVRM